MAGRTFTVAQQKGGSGKTTLASHLAVAFARGGKSVAVLDTDPQGSLGEWFEARERRLGEDAAGLEFRTASGWGARREARSLSRDYDIVVIDTPPKSDLELRPAIEVASLVLVVNRALKRATLTAEMIEAIGKLGHRVADTALGNRVAYAASMGDGRTVVETAPSSVAAREVLALADEILRTADQLAG
jgi:chromosome partitioning protein